MSLKSWMRKGISDVFVTVCADCRGFVGRYWLCFGLMAGIAKLKLLCTVYSEWTRNMQAIETHIAEGASSTFQLSQLSRGVYDRRHVERRGA